MVEKKIHSTMQISVNCLREFNFQLKFFGLEFFLKFPKKPVSIIQVRWKRLDIEQDL